MFELVSEINELLLHHLLAVIIIYFLFRIVDLSYSKIYYYVEVARNKRFQMTKIKRLNYSNIPDKKHTIDNVIKDVQENTHNDTTTNNSSA